MASRSETLLPSAARTTGSQTSSFGGWGDTLQLRAQIDVTAASGTSPNLTAFIEDTLDGTNWNVIGTFAAKTAAGREVISVTTPYADDIRVRWVITGTTPSFTFAVVTHGQ
ncbi:MAG: hypothetical protein M3Q82_04010 [Actinomycetota bacterium]|nr:hypothetical protein [Actinomycetota bacterium]